MKQRHKNADVIVAWAEGAEVEYRKGPDRPWVPVPSPSNWYDYEGVEYRIKPPPAKYRVALFNSGNNGSSYTSTADTQKDVHFFEASHGFIRWLTDWIEYEE